MNISNYLADKILNASLRGVNFVAPATVYIALYTSDPTRADVGIEVNRGSYARQAVTFDAPMDISNKRTTLNTTDIVYPVATADQGTVSHIGIRDAATGGNLLWFGPLTLAKIILNGDRLKVLDSDLPISVS